MMMKNAKRMKEAVPSNPSGQACSGGGFDTDAELMSAGGCVVRVAESAPDTIDEESESHFVCPRMGSYPVSHGCEGMIWLHSPTHSLLDRVSEFCTADIVEQLSADGPAIQLLHEPEALRARQQVFPRWNMQQHVTLR